MNILIPDIWLREYLKTKATSLQLKQYLSLCGPSIERIYGTGKETVYDVEITGNRPDGMSVMGVAREAATILPRFGIEANLVGDPYAEKLTIPKGKATLNLTITSDPMLNPRWMSVVFDDVTIKPSPSWLTQYLTLAGIRSLNNVVDVTNFLMHAYGQPAHVFDYDAIVGHTMILRSSKKHEKLTTLDGKIHTLPGDDIVIEDGSGKLIDLCGIMGGENSSIKETTHRIVLFLQTYDPTHIRKTSMALAHRTAAAGLFEKGLDTELVKPALYKGAQLITELSGGVIASKITDLYPKPYKPYTVLVNLSKIHSYIGKIDTKDISRILTSLGCTPVWKKNMLSVTVPSFRRDITIDVDVIEEIARVHGYHNIPSILPQHAPPMTLPDIQLSFEEELKVQLRDWGYTELYTYSMISSLQMNQFNLDKTKAYAIANPLSVEWEYMRPSLWPSVLTAVKENIGRQKTLKVFELSMIYEWKANSLPQETPILLTAYTGDAFFEAKGLAERIFSQAGIPFPTPDSTHAHDWHEESHCLSLGIYGCIAVVKKSLLQSIGITQSVTILDINIQQLIRHASPAKTYTPVPKNPTIIEDLAFDVPEKFAIGPLITTLKHAHPIVQQVSLLDAHEQTRTLHIEYQDPKRNLTNEDVAPVREKLISIAKTTFGITLKA